MVTWKNNIYVTQGIITPNTHLTQMVPDFVIGQHLSSNPDCTDKYIDLMFTILGKAQSAKYLHILEAVYIKLH